MTRSTVLAPLCGLLLAGLLAAGCSSDDPAGIPAGTQVPDFSLPDVNTTSATFDQAVSPRDYLEQVSAWYFGHST